MARLLTFVHRSPYATWNTLQAFIRQEQSCPEEVVVLHLESVRDHAGLVVEGIERMLRHYGGAPSVRLVEVHENRFPAWMDAIGSIIGSGEDWTLDITAARTVPTIAAAEATRSHEGTRAIYLDVEGYRYEAKPFTWVPSNIQTLRTLIPGQQEETYRKVQYFGPYRAVPPMDRLGAGPKLDPAGAREINAHWEALIVLLNEAGAAATGRKGAEGVSHFEIKIPHLGVTVGSYDMERSRLRLSAMRDIQDQLLDGLGFMTGAWGHDIPSESDILEALTAARILPYANQDELERALHSAARSTGGARANRKMRWIGLDTNMFHLETITTIARHRRIPLSRIPLVVSHVVHDELHHQMDAKLPRGDPPRPVVDADIHRPHKARLAHVGHEEFELLRSRSRMEIHTHGKTQQSSDLNDQTIVDDMAHYAQTKHEPVMFLTNDEGCHQRAEAAGTGLLPIRVQFGDPRSDLDPHPPIHKIAYFVYRLALAFGRVSLKGLGVDIRGDHPDDQRHAYLHEEVRVRIPDKDWTRGFVHEVQLRKKLDEVVEEAGVWL